METVLFNDLVDITSSIYQGISPVGNIVSLFCASFADDVISLQVIYIRCVSNAFDLQHI